jgi:hypothetical protein
MALPMLAWQLIDTKSFSKYGGESNENLKYVLSRNLLNTKGTQ